MQTEFIFFYLLLWFSLRRATFIENLARWQEKKVSKLVLTLATIIESILTISSVQEYKKYIFNQPNAKQSVQTALHMQYKSLSM